MDAPVLRFSLPFLKCTLSGSFYYSVMVFQHSVCTIFNGTQISFIIVSAHSGHFGANGSHGAIELHGSVWQHDSDCSLRNMALLGNVMLTMLG
jgi:hypothetical protein